MHSRQTLAALSIAAAVSFIGTQNIFAQATRPAAAGPMPTTHPVAARSATPAPAAAATSPVEVPTSDHAFVGVVNGSSVNVRSGPANSYYITMQLNKGDRVVAVGSKYDWLKIVPPKGSYSCVAKRYVTRAEGASEGMINADDVLIRAGSNVNQQKQPQTKLSRGAKVTIIGEVDDMYKIVPPDGAYLYIAKNFVEPLRAATAEDTRVVAAAVAAAAASTQPVRETPAVTDVPPVAGEAAPQGTATDLVPVTPAVPAEPSKAGGAVVEEYDRLAASFDAMQKQPVEERSLGDLRTSYEALAARPELPDGMRRVARNRVAILKVLEQQQAEIIAAKKDAASFRSKLAETENQRREIEQRMKNVGVAVYTAVGTLQNSTVQQGDQPLLRLVDPADGQTVVYIRTSDAAQIAMVGQFVGVRGEVVSDQRLSVKVISPMSMEAVDQNRVARGVTALYMPASFIKKQAGEIQSGPATAPAAAPAAAPAPAPEAAPVTTPAP